MYKIEQRMFENAVVMDTITQEYVDSLREFSVIYGNYKYNLCYIITNTYFDAFTKSSTWIQTLITLTTDNDGESSIDHIKSRYLKPLSTTGDLVWTRWQTEDANTYNYLNGYLKESDKTVLREWKDSTYEETEIDFVVNTLEDETQINHINFANHQNELFLVPDNSTQLYSVDTLPEPSVDYLNMYYIPKQETIIGSHTFPRQMLYVCVENSGDDSTTYPYMWEYALVFGEFNPKEFIYDVVSEVEEIPGV